MVVLFCLVLCIWEFTIIVKKAIAQESFQAINELQFNELLPPTITLCPGEAWKSSGPFLNDDHCACNSCIEIIETIARRR